MGLKKQTDLFVGNIHFTKLWCNGQCLLLHDQISNTSVKQFSAGNSP